MADVFISYKRERRPAARHLEQILIRYGYSVWFDLALVRGADYEDQIQRQLNAAKAVVVLWCGLSVQSGGVRSEATRAKSQGKLIPVVIEPCELPLFSTLEQNIDLTTATGSPRDHALDPVLDDVERLVGRPPAADLKALREYETTWRTMGSLTLARFPREKSALPDDPVVPRVLGTGTTSAPPSHDYAFWSAEWEKQRLGHDLVALRLIADEAPRYFAEQAKARIADIEAEQRVAGERAATEHRYRAEGRIKVDAKIIHGAPDGWFKSGAGKAEWFKDLDAGPRMIVVPAGSFEMGSRPGVGRHDERPHRTVTIAQPFAIGLAPVTRGEFASFVAATRRDMSGGAVGWTGAEWKHDAKSWSNPGFAQTDAHPVVCVSWEDAEAYAAWLAGETGKSYRLPSEAEWEYCCRATTKTAYAFGETITPQHANYGRNEKGTTSVGKYAANAWGAVDMHGNAWEWCADNWHPNYEGNPPLDGSVWQGGDTSVRVVRGGSWFFNPDFLRSAFRGLGVAPGFRGGNIGFRVARVVSPARTL